MIQTEDPFKDTSWAYEINSSNLPFLSSCTHPYPSSMALNLIQLFSTFHIVVCQRVSIKLPDLEPRRDTVR